MRLRLTDARGRRLLPGLLRSSDAGVAAVAEQHEVRRVVRSRAEEAEPVEMVDVELFGRAAFGA